MVEYLVGGRIPRSKYPRATLDQFALEEDILYLCKQKVDGCILYLLVVPGELRREALSYIHDKESGHPGQHKTLLKAEEFFYWPNLRGATSENAISVISHPIKLKLLHIMENKTYIIFEFGNVSQKVNGF